MSTCRSCKEEAVFSQPPYCSQHFTSYIEDKVTDTIKKFNLVDDKDKLAVAVSGGKDSQTALYILSKLYKKNVSAVAVDEGIPGYRDKTLEDLKKFCSENQIKHTVLSFDKSFGTTISQLIAGGAPSCRSCGVMRRNLINLGAKGFDKLATGHNLDDECQSILMNLLKGNIGLLARMGPISGTAERKGFTRRVKPLFLCTEKEIAAYAFLKNFPVQFNECPHAEGSFRSKVRDHLNIIESARPGTKLKIAERFISILQRLREKSDKSLLSSCSSCGSPTLGKYCMACKAAFGGKNAS